MATGLPVSKTLIEYNRNSLEEKEKESEEGANWYSVYWTKRWSWNYENAIDFRLSDVKEEDEEILLWLTWFRAYKSKLMKKVS